MNLQPIFIREQVIKAIRSFFEEKKFHEVITPSFSKGLTIEPNIFPFSTEWNTSEKINTLYLTTSPEIGMKKMLAQGIGNCFAIGKSFRNLEGAGSQHIPEFLMLEWYRENAEYQKIIQDAQELIKYIKKTIDASSSNLSYQGKTIDLNEKFEVLSLETLFPKYTGLQLSDVVKDEFLFNASQEKGYSTQNASWSQLYDQIFVNEIESKLPNTPFFLTDFPSRTSPLCKVNEGKKYLAERFEMYIFGMEVANGNNENTDSKVVKDMFVHENEYRKANKLPFAKIDEEFILALDKMSDKKYAGIGLGVDRLAMIFADTTDITDIEVFYKSI